MGCNAWNHHSSCNCGWGGATGGGWGYTTPAPISRNFTTERPTVRLSVTIPNARCPVCGAEVYFFESPYGGRVFFDELGPPWPKHHCTDNRRSLKGPVSRDHQDRPPPQWHREGWINLQNTTIVRRSTATIVEGDGLLDRAKHTFAVTDAIRCEPDDPIFVRRSDRGDGSWEIEYFPANSSLVRPTPEASIGFPDATQAEQLKQWVRLADQDPEARNLVGMHLSFARGNKSADGTWTFRREPDWAAAELHFLLAASAGYWAGFHNLGVMYQHGFGVRKDPELSIHLMLNAAILAKEECAASVEVLAKFLKLGWGTDEDRNLASALVAEASN